MIVSAIISVVLGLFLGEEISLLWPPSFLLAGVGMLALGIALTPGNFPSRIVGGFMLLLPLVSGFVAGRYEGTTAFQESVDRAEVVQTALKAHRETTGAFPDSLEVLEGIELPGKRLLRGRVLHYRKTADGYQMSVERWALRFDGDERTAFAHRP